MHCKRSSKFFQQSNSSVFMYNTFKNLTSHQLMKSLILNNRAQISSILPQNNYQFHFCFPSQSGSTLREFLPSQEQILSCKIRPHFGRASAPTEANRKSQHWFPITRIPQNAVSRLYELCHRNTAKPENQASRLYKIFHA